MKNQAFWSWQDGKFIKSPSISCNSGGFLHGYGLFETIYFKEGVLHHWDAHMDRIERSCRRYGLAFWGEGLREVALELCERNFFSEARVRLTVATRHTQYEIESKDSMILLQASEYQRVNREYRLNSYKASQFGCSLSQHKTLSYNGYLLAKRTAILEGADEALLLDHSGSIVECSSANIILYKAGQWYTPPLSEYGLRGIQLAVVKRVLERMNIPLQNSINLSEAWEFAFLCNSLIGIQPVVSIDGRVFDQKKSIEFGRIKEEVERL